MRNKTGALLRGVRVVVLVAALAICSARAQAAVMFGATAAGAPGELYTINPATGAIITDIGPLHDAGNTNYPITGLAFHPITGVLYGSTGNAGAVDAKLVTINPVTALVAVIGNFNTGLTNAGGTPATMADIDFDSSGNLYGVASIGGPSLFSINTTTGQATLVGPNGVATSTTGGGLAIRGGSFYGTPTSSLFGTYNPVNGAFSNIVNPVKPVNGAYAALTVNPDTGELYGLNLGSASPPPTHIVRFNPTSGAVTDLGASVTFLDAIAFTPEPGSSALLLLAGVIATAHRRPQRC